jgi:AcrR family transcriptional regulator
MASKQQEPDIHSVVNNGTESVQERAEMSEIKSEDRRVKRTRAAIQSALLSLMTEKSYESISVQDIIDRADVGRATFYNHFADKEDLLRDGIEGLTQMLFRDAESAAAGNDLAFSLPILRHFAEQRPLVVAMLSRQGGASLLPHFVAVTTAGVRREVEKRGHAHAVPDEALVRFLAGGFLALVEWWMLDEPLREPEEVDATFQQLASAHFDR